MSLVGPRPALRAEMADWEPALYARLDVKPGITGMWQVSGRSGTTFEEYTRLDLYYVHNWSMVVDLSIMLRTIPAVLRSDGSVLKPGRSGRAGSGGVGGPVFDRPGGERAALRPPPLRLEPLVVGFPEAFR